MLFAAYFLELFKATAKTAILVLLCKTPVFQVIGFNVVILGEFIFVEQTCLYGEKLNEEGYAYRELLFYELLFNYHIICMSSFVTEVGRQNDVATSAITMVLLIIARFAVTISIELAKDIKKKVLEKIEERK